MPEILPCKELRDARVHELMKCRYVLKIQTVEAFLFGQFFCHDELKNVDAADQ